MVLRERALLARKVIEQPIVTEPAYFNETLRKGYFESLARTIQAGLSGLTEEEDKIKAQSLDEKVAEGMHEQVHSKRNALTMLQAVLSQASSL